ncbi:bifunctional adenosylcobinamide kinase/adenosylcobinamide-phosphate guanylyltransferase [Cohnella panacarvi]|uniref:bifunctional adenosylcobinamide kinase/adenosylcobinamide-phosphate guanylyltransferase n=1 Tax=Cohnella panacarvi TaxID=400776 RepID=UPI0004786EF8|nr:bifunctional adenosylcobinamide kinase/adenosylcobinamide-phosphate guanylyltransferase [Cohnella panacarvi]
MIVLVTGGAKSGKSSFAEQVAMHTADSAVYIATAQIFEEEMRTRFVRHRERRDRSGYAWETIEEPYELAAMLRTVPDNRTILVDCLTLWASNWLLRAERDADGESLVQRKIEELAAAISARQGTTILVTNEVGSGIVPEYPLGRYFRDVAGGMNQRLASLSDQVFLVTAGIPVELKRLAFRFDGGML